MHAVQGVHAVEEDGRSVPATSTDAAGTATEHAAVLRQHRGCSLTWGAGPAPPTHQVAPPAQQLPVALLLGEGLGAVLPGNVGPAGQDGVAHVPGEGGCVKAALTAEVVVPSLGINSCLCKMVSPSTAL